MAITGDGQHVLVTEFDKSEIALITNAGRLKEWSNKSLQNPCGVAVSPDDKHIFVASINGMLHKFTMPSSAARPVCVASVNLKGFGVAVHAPSSLCQLHVSPTQIVQTIKIFKCHQHPEKSSLSVQHYEHYKGTGHQKLSPIHI